MGLNENQTADLKIAITQARSRQLSDDLEAFYPTSLLVTGFDILFFWVARMIMLGCHFTLDIPMPDGSKRPLSEAVPFREVYIHGLVRDANREKMSKTKGNVINPIDIIERFGTDAVRFTLASMASPGTDIAFSEARTEGYRAFANKIWNAARFLFMNIDRAREAGYKVTINTPTNHSTPRPWTLPENTPLETRWIFDRLHAVTAEVDRALTNYRFDEAANAIYQFFWGELCDWYLELVKLRLGLPRVRRHQIHLQRNHRAHPPRPHRSLRVRPSPPQPLHALHHRRDLARPLQRRTAGKIHRPHSLSASRRLPCRSHRGKCDEALQDLIVTIRALRKELCVPEKESTPIALHASNRVIALADANQDMLVRLARVNSMDFTADPLSGTNARSTADFDVAVIYERQIDVPAERERLTKDLAKYEKGLTAAERQLGNEAFMAKAPTHIVEGLRKQSAETKDALRQDQGRPRRLELSSGCVR